jgi:hypothetical protein
LAYFALWIPLAIYVVVLTVSILVYFRMSDEDEVRATEAQRPLKEWLTTALRWTLRGAIALISGVVFLASGGFGLSTIPNAISAIRGLRPATPVAVVEAVRPPQADPLPRLTLPAVAYGAIADAPSTTALRPIDVAEVSKTVENSILGVLAAAETSPRGSIEDLAKEAGRNFDFSIYHVDRNRKEARRLNEAAMRAYSSDGGVANAYDLQKQAMAADPFDVEVAGNLAIYALRSGSVEEARLHALYALALPRGADRTGRTADWSTLAAVYAAAGNAFQARNALFVTLAIAPDVAKRCKSAVHAVRNTYGEVMKEPTTAMFDRIKAEGLSDSPECALPIQW